MATEPQAKRKTMTAEERRQMSIEKIAASDKERTKDGRPSDYSIELAQEICEAISSCTLSLGKLCSINKNWPCRDTISIWRVRYRDFSDMYMNAKRAQCDLYAEECVDISDSDDLDATMRDNLRVSTRKWFVSKLAPKLYGDRVVLEDGSGKEEVIKSTQKKLEKVLQKRKKV